MVNAFLAMKGTLLAHGHKCGFPCCTLERVLDNAFELLVTLALSLAGVLGLLQSPCACSMCLHLTH